jgi:2-oxoglutarate ferredoxin oxidoreductase subunit gamma
MAVDAQYADGPVEIRISGYGGQGVVLAGLLLGKAAALYDGKESVFTQSYGPEARGGASCADVIIAPSPIEYPLVSSPDILVAMFQEAYLRFRPTLKPGGVLILESGLVHPGEENGCCYRIPATEMAEKFGRRVVANVIVVGFLVGKTGVVSREAAEEALRNTVKKKTVDLNLRAFDAGYRLAVSGG